METGQETKMIYAITYDLKKPGQDYAELHDAIKSLGGTISTPPGSSTRR
jgi:hypothetical protein